MYLFYCTPIKKALLHGHIKVIHLFFYPSICLNLFGAYFLYPWPSLFSVNLSDSVNLTCQNHIFFPFLAQFDSYLSLPTVPGVEKYWKLVSCSNVKVIGYFHAISLSWPKLIYIELNFKLKSEVKNLAKSSILRLLLMFFWDGHYASQWCLK